MVRTSMVPMLLVCCGLAAQTPGAGRGQAPEPEGRPPDLPAVQPPGGHRPAGPGSDPGRHPDQPGPVRLEPDRPRPRPSGWTPPLPARSARQAPSATSRPHTYNRTLTGDLNKNFEWGGNLDLNYSPAYSYRRGAYLGYPIPGTNTYWNSQTPYTGSFTATYTQSLLQNFGRK